MKKNKSESKIKTWFKNLFKSKKKSTKQTLSIKETICEEQEKLFPKDSGRPRKYSYLKTPEQKAFYDQLRKIHQQRPKYEKIKKPRIKKNQEGGFSVITVRLGKGTFGDVYRCFCLSNQRFFAVKKIFVSYQNQKHYQKKIQEEFDIAKDFNHENIGTKTDPQ